MTKKRIDLIDILYDFIFIYALSKFSVLINDPINGIVTWNFYLRYFILMLTLLLLWFFSTCYKDRYSENTNKEKTIMAIHMVTILWIGSIASSDWMAMETVFNTALFVDYAGLVYLYYDQLKYTKQKSFAKQSLLILTIILIIYGLAVVCLLANRNITIIGFDVLALILGILLPCILYTKKNKICMHFSYMLEQFQLMSVGSIGVCILSITSYFDMNQVSILPILAFFVLLFLYGAYTCQMQNLIEEKPKQKSTVMVISQILIIMCLHLFSVILKLLYDGTFAPDYLSYFIVIVYIVLFLSLLVNRIYYKSEVHFRMIDHIQMIVGDVVGLLCIFILNYSIYGNLLGMLIINGMNYYVLHRVDFLTKFQ